MKKNITFLNFITIFFVLLCVSCFSISATAQTYATLELKRQVEKADAEKNKRLNISNEEDASIQNPKVEVTNLNTEPIDLASPDLFKLISLTAVDVNGKHTQQQMVDFNEEALIGIERNKIVIDWDKKIWFEEEKGNNKGQSAREFRARKSSLTFLKCKECQEYNFTIVEHTANKLLLQIAPQDEGRFFVFQFEFVR